MALRTSVKLEHYAADSVAFRAADIDRNGAIEASDARVILRVSVKLETLPEVVCDHVWDEGVVTKPFRWPDSGEKVYTCTVCGEQKTESIPISVDDFNRMVNVLKDGTHTYSGFSEAKNNCGKVQITGSMHEITDPFIKSGYISKEEIKSGVFTLPELSRSKLIKEKKINDHSFPLTDKNVVCDLRESDHAVITVTTADGLGFLTDLPDSYINDNNEEEDLTEIKNWNYGDLFKVTVALSPEEISDLGDVSAIARTDPELIEFVKSFQEQEQRSIEAPGEGDDWASLLAKSIRVQIDGTARCTVTYYFETESQKPVAAVYNGVLLMNQSVDLYFDDLYFDGTINQTDYPTGGISADITSNITSYYFFD